MEVEVYILERGTVVKIKNPRQGERGEWRVIGRVPNSGLDDPAYDVINTKSGRQRIFRWSRMLIKGQT